MQLHGRWRTSFGLAVAIIVASATVGAQKPVCTVSELGRSQEKSVPEALKGPDSSATLSPEQRKAAADDAQKAVKKAQAEAKQKYGAPSQGFISSLFSPDDPVRASNLDVKRVRLALSLERNYLAPVLAQYRVSCVGLRAIVDAEKPATPATPAAAPSK